MSGGPIDLREGIAREIYDCRCRTANTKADWDALGMHDRIQFKVEADATLRWLADRGYAIVAPTPPRSSARS